MTSDNLAKFSERIPDEIITAATEMLHNPNADEFREITISGSEEND